MPAAAHRGGDRDPARHVPALGAHHARRDRRRCRPPICPSGWGRPASCCSGWRAGSIWRRSCPDPGVPRFMQSIELEWPIDALEPLSFVLARLLDPLVGGARARRSRGRGAAARSAPRRSDGARTHAAAAGRDARREGAAHAAAPRSRVASARPRPSTSSPSRSIRRRRASSSTRCSSARCRRRKRSPRSPPGSARSSANGACGSPALLDSYRPDAFEMRRFDPECVAPGAAAESLRALLDAASGGALHPAPLPSAHRGPRDARARPSGTCRHRSPRHAGRRCRAGGGPLAHVGCLVGRRRQRHGIATSGTSP